MMNIAEKMHQLVELLKKPGCLGGESGDICFRQVEKECISDWSNLIIEDGPW